MLIDRFNPDDVSVSINDFEDHSKGHHVAEVYLVMVGFAGVFDWDERRYIHCMEKALESCFPGAVAGSHYYSRDKGWQFSLAWKRQSKYKKELPEGTSKTMLGELVSQYGNLEAAALEAINQGMERLKLLERAENIVEQTYDISCDIAKRARERAAEAVNYNERLAKLKAELEAECKVQLQTIVEGSKQWEYSKGNPVEPEVVTLVTDPTNVQHIAGRFKGVGSIGHHSVHPNHLNKERDAPWLAMHLASSDDD